MSFFTNTWFETLAKKNFDNVKKYLTKDNKELPAINYLEIGCYQGNCHLYMYENILTHPDCKSTVIEPFGGGTGSSQHENAYEIFVNNLKDHLHKIHICCGLSNNYLHTLEPNTYDIVYIDGDHSSIQTYLDGINSWSLLKKGGIMIFDDYLWHGFGITLGNLYWGMRIGEYNHPAAGINRFLEEKKGEYFLFGKKEGFDTECKILDLNRLGDPDYASHFIANFNYQIWIKKI